VRKKKKAKAKKVQILSRITLEPCHNEMPQNSQAYRANPFSCILFLPGTMHF